MNFDTKYLIRWGIPGWTMIMVLFPYLIITYYDKLEMKENFNSTDFLAVGVVFTVLGVPLGHLLNQIHHSITWVIPKIRKDKWLEYFKEEIEADNIFAEDVYKRERYRYLLSKKHEIGGILVSFIISGVVILLMNIGQNNQGWAWFYLIIVLLLTIIMFISRLYSSENINYYFNNYLLGNLEKKVGNENETEQLRESEEEFSFHYKKKN